MFRLGPSHTSFYDLFDRSAEVLVKGAERLHTFLGEYENPERHADEIHRYEHEADEVTHQGLELLHQSFVTPLERNEIWRLIESLDDVMDFIDNAACRMVLHDIREVLPEAKELARVLVGAVHIVRAAVANLRTVRSNVAEVRRHCREVRRLETEGDRINHDALARMFKSDFDPFAVLKWKEIIGAIETAIDRCQDVANVVEGIAIESC
jgi:uncharacterized protein